jgi:4-amino-4-deoxy-L-arabinose transferase-like glycosyltransferase
VIALRERRIVGVAAALVVAALAVAFRCWRLFTVPPGLFVDEVLTARNALAWRLDAHASLFGSRPLLMPGWVETSNLYLAFVSAVMWLGGDGLLGIRLVSVLPSLAAVPLLYWLGAQLAGRRAGLLAAFLLACSHWAARSGRTGWDAVLMATLQLAALACLVHAQRRDRLAPAFVAGALVGLALYTYVASRLVLAHAILWLAWEALVDRRPRSLARALVFVATMLAIAAPWRQRLVHLGGSRVPQLSVFSHDHAWRAIADNLIGHLSMFHVRGGTYARDALPGFPMLDAITGLLLLAGLIMVVRTGQGTPRDVDTRMRRRLLISWPAIMVVGGVLSVSGEGPPYPYRVLALAPWACLVAAIGGIALWDAARGRFAPALRAGIATIALLAVVAINAWALFVAGPRDPGTRHVYGTAPTQLGLWLRDHGQGRPVVILPSALASPPLPRDYRYAPANPTNFFRQADDITAVQLAAGLYRRHPERALDPFRPAGDIDFLPALPARVSRDTILVLPPSLLPEASRRFRVRSRTDLRDSSGARLATLVAAGP